MISREELKKITRVTNLTLYQQEKDYLLKLFLFNYYKRFEGAVFKGGTCIRYLFGLNRFSEDLDFNLKIRPKKFREQVEKTLNEIRMIGINIIFRKKEMFKDAFTCEMNFEGPLFKGVRRSMNKFRIDAGKRTGIVLKPKWQLITSEYPETPKNFLILTMDEKEILAEKIASLFTRVKGRDLYDVWFLLKRGVKIDKKLVKKKFGLKKRDFPSKREYERDMERLTLKVVPYKQVRREVEEKLIDAGFKT